MNAARYIPSAALPALLCLMAGAFFAGAADASKAAPKGGILSGPLNELGIVRKAVRDTMWDVAEQHAKRVEKDRAQRLAARRAQLEAHAGKGEWEAALKKAAEWDADEPHEVYRYWRAYALMQLERADDAQGVLEGVEFKDPAYAVLALRLRARVAMAKGDRAQAGVHLKRAAELAKDPGERAEILVEHARLLTSSGDAAAEALEVLKKGGALQTSGAAGDVARLLSAELQAASGADADAEKTLRELVAAGDKTAAPVFADAACLLSQGLWQRGATNEARTIAAQAVARAPTPSMRIKAGYLLGFQEFCDAKARAAGSAASRPLCASSRTTPPRAMRSAVSPTLSSPPDSTVTPSTHTTSTSTSPPPPSSTLRCRRAAASRSSARATAPPPLASSHSPRRKPPRTRRSARAA